MEYKEWIIINNNIHTFNLNSYPYYTKNGSSTSRGPDENSVILHASTFQNGKKVFLPIELIENITKEFLN